MCDEVKQVLQDVRTHIPFELIEIDIESDRGLFEQYCEQIPVVFINGRKAFKYRIDRNELFKKLRRLI